MTATKRARPAFDAGGYQASAEPVARATATPWPQSELRIVDPRASGVLRVLVVSDIRLLQEAFATLLGGQEGVCVIGITNLEQASSRAADLHPDIVLFDATRTGSLDCARALADLVPMAKIVAFGVAENDTEIVTLAAAGIAGFVRDDAGADDVVAVLKSAMRDELLCSPRTAATLCHQVAVLSRSGHDGQSTDITVPILSKRELQVGALIDRGLSNKEIARQLGIEVTTVKNHVHNIFDKLKVHRRGQAAARLRAALGRTASPP